MAHAYGSHPALGAQRANVRALDQDVDSALAGWRPTVSVSTGTGRHTNAYALNDGPRISSDRNPADLRVSASQPLLNWTTGPAVDAAEARVRQGRADLLASEQNVLFDAASAYLNVLQYRKLLALHEANERSLARQVAYRSEHFQRRLGTRTELAQAQARHAAAVAQLNRVRTELDSYGSAFLRTIGMPAGQDLGFPNGLPTLPENLEPIIANAAYNMPAVRSAYYGAQAARADAQAAKGRLMPSVSLEASGAWTRNPEATMRSQRDASVQLTLRIPIYQGGAEWAGVRGSKQREIQQQEQLRNSRLQARYDASDAWNKLQAARAEIKAFETAIAANKVAYEGVSEQHAVLGELTLIEVLNAQQELFLSEVSLVQARTQAVLSHLRLLAVQGRLTAEGLGLSVAGHPAADMLQ